MTDYGIRLGYWDRTCRETLWFRQDGHLTLVSPSGQGKFRDVLCGAGALWPGSILWIDPKLQAGCVLARHLSETHDVQLLNPFNLFPERLGQFKQALVNPLSTLDCSLDSFGADCDVNAEGIVTEESHSGMDNHFILGAKDGYSGLMGALVRHCRPEERNLATAREILCGPSFFKFCREIVSITNDPFIRQKLGRFTPPGVEENRETLGVVSTMITQSAFVANKALADNLSQSTIRWRDFKKRPTCLFLGLPARYLSSCSKWFRLIFANAMSQFMYEEQGIPILVVCDEFPAMKRLTIAETAMGMARGFGVRMFLVMQDLNQLKSVYGADAFQTFLANASCRMFFGPQDKFTAEYVSDMCGETEARTVSKSLSHDKSGALQINSSVAPHARKYLRPEAIRELPSDEMLVFGAGLSGVIRAARRPYYQCPELVGTYDGDPYQIGGDL